MTPTHHKDPCPSSVKHGPILFYCEAHYAEWLADETTTAASTVGITTEAECAACFPPEGIASCPICGRIDTHTSCDIYMMPGDVELHQQIFNAITALKDDFGYGDEHCYEMMETMIRTIFKPQDE